MIHTYELYRDPMKSALFSTVYIFTPPQTYASPLRGNVYIREKRSLYIYPPAVKGSLCRVRVNNKMRKNRALRAIIASFTNYLFLFLKVVPRVRKWWKWKHEFEKNKNKNNKRKTISHTWIQLSPPRHLTEITNSKQTLTYTGTFTDV